MNFNAFIFLIINVFLLSACAFLPKYASTSPSTVKVMTFGNAKIVIHDSGFETKLSIENGCLSAMGVPLILSSRFELRHKANDHYIYDRESPIAKIGENVLLGGHFTESIEMYLAKQSPRCPSSTYFLVGDISRL